MTQVNRRQLSRWELGLGLSYAVWFLACDGTGSSGGSGDVFGPPAGDYTYDYGNCPQVPAPESTGPSSPEAAPAPNPAPEAPYDPPIYTRERNIEGIWRGTAFDRRGEGTHELGLAIGRTFGDELDARVMLDGETVDAYEVRSGSRRSVRIRYEFPSGRKGWLRGKVRSSGVEMRGVLRMQEGTAAHSAKFRLFFQGAGQAVRTPSRPSAEALESPGGPEVLLHEDFENPYPGSWAFVPLWTPVDEEVAPSWSGSPAGKAGAMVLRSGIPMVARTSIPERASLRIEARLKPARDGSVTVLLGPPVPDDGMLPESVAAVRVVSGASPSVEVWNHGGWTGIPGTLPVEADGWTRLVFTVRAGGRLEFPVPDGEPCSVVLPDAVPFPMAILLEGGTESLVDEIVVTGP